MGALGGVPRARAGRAVRRVGAYSSSASRAASTSSEKSAV